MPMGILQKLSAWWTAKPAPLGFCVWCEAKTPGASACSAEHQEAFDKYERSGLFA